MTYEEAWIRFAHNNVFDKENKNDAETIDLAIEAIMKQIPTKPTRIPCDDEGLYFHVECPNCEKRFGFKAHHCTSCGQAIDWEC